MFVKGVHIIATISPSLGHMAGPTLLLLQLVVDHDSLPEAVLVYLTSEAPYPHPEGLEHIE